MRLVYSPENEVRWGSAADEGGGARVANKTFAIGSQHMCQQVERAGAVRINEGDWFTVQR